MTRKEANAQAAKIRKYWADRGKHPYVTVWPEVVRVSKTVRKTVYVIRSDMRNGVPA